MCSAKLDSNDRKDGATIDGEEFLKFELGDATVYSRVCKQLLNEAKAITPHGRDIARMWESPPAESAWLGYCYLEPVDQRLIRHSRSAKVRSPIVVSTTTIGRSQ
jgi:hypothetical protein